MSGAERGRSLDALSPAQGSGVMLEWDMELGWDVSWGDMEPGWDMELE